MNLSRLPKIVERKAKRLGRGIASGKGKTAGRGTKGQKAHENVPSYFAGGGGRRNRLLKRLPYLRGIGNRAVSQKPLLISLDRLAKHPAGEVTMDSLVVHGIVDVTTMRRSGVKLSGVGNVAAVYTVSVPVTRSAQQKLEQAGGAVLTRR